MFGQPRAQRGHDIDRLFSLVEETFLLLDLQGRLDALQELNGKGVALVNIRDVAVEAGFGVVVGQQAHVLELPAEDIDYEDDRFRRRLVRGLGDVGRDAADGVFAAARCAAVHGAGDAAAAEATLAGHVCGGMEGWEGW